MNNIKIVPMNADHLESLERLERICFSRPWSRKMLAEELENQCAAFLVAEDAVTDDVLGYAGLLSRARYTGKALWLQILVVVKVLLWSLLLIVPGYIAAIRYSMAIFTRNPMKKTAAIDAKISASRTLALRCSCVVIQASNQPITRVAVSSSLGWPIGEPFIRVWVTTRWRQLAG